jgi:hypothetical protein
LALVIVQSAMRRPRAPVMLIRPPSRPSGMLPPSSVSPLSVTASASCAANREGPRVSVMRAPLAPINCEPACKVKNPLR